MRRAEYGIRFTAALAIPAIGILSAVTVTVVMVMLERGAFDHAATLSVAAVLPAIMISNVGFAMLGNILGRTFYVLKDTVTAPATAFVMSACYIVLAKLMVDSWGISGLAWAAAIQRGNCQWGARNYAVSTSSSLQWRRDPRQLCQIRFRDSRWSVGCQRDPSGCCLPSGFPATSH